MKQITKLELIEMMKNCEQTKGQSVLEHYLKYYGNNSKCVISNILFLNKKMKSVKNNKFVQSKIEEVLKNQS